MWRLFLRKCTTSIPRLRLATSLLCFAGLTWLILASQPTAATPRSAPKEFSFHHDHIIGTSLDLWVRTQTESEAEVCEQAILAEIERLRLIFSTYDSQSEISRFNRASGAVSASPEMREVLHAYETWQQQSHGAFNGQLGELVNNWKDAQKTGAEPSAATLQQIVGEINKPGWMIDDVRGTVERLNKQPLNLNAIAKGFIIRQAASAARAKVPSLHGLLLNLGGDMLAWGDDVDWTVGVQDPFHPEENAPPLTVLRLHNRAVATSGAYERPYHVGDKSYSHIFDPRTGWPAEGVASSTVVARDNVTANALATTLCVLAPEDGLRLVAATPNVECLLITAAGKQLRSAGFKVLELASLPRKRGEGVLQDSLPPLTREARQNSLPPLTREARQNSLPPLTREARQVIKADDVKDAWPEGFQVNLTVTLPTPNDGKRYRRPYVAVWIENADGKAVRSLSVWGNSPKYLRDLSDWWKFAQKDNDVVKAVTRATRAPGKYTIVWDGKDDKGKPLPQGTYTMQVEVTREFGRHLSQTGKIECRAETAKTTLEKNAETDATLVEYTKKK